MITEDLVKGHCMFICIRSKLSGKNVFIKPTKPIFFSKKIKGEKLSISRINISHNVTIVTKNVLL